MNKEKAIKDISEIKNILSNDDISSTPKHKKDFKKKFLVYFGTMVLLLIVNLLSNPDYLWVVWPALGWGGGILISYLKHRK